MKTHPGFSRLALLAFVVTAISGAAFADSHVRIVRLSSVEGQVQIDRATGQGLERAILNTPIVEGTRIVTGADGLAEVEFENQSALRLTENSEVKFTQLLMNDAGTKANRIIVDKGLVYLDTASKGDDRYLITVGDQSLEVGTRHLDENQRYSGSASGRRLQGRSSGRGSGPASSRPQEGNAHRRFEIDVAERRC